nr:hypothetical protein BaRGS_017701 [Batillaria attramentaria]
MVFGELIQEKAFVVERAGVQTAVLVSRDPQLGEAAHYSSVSVYDFSSPQPVTAIKPYFQGQPCFLLPGPAGDFNATLTMLTDRNGQTVNATAPPVELTASGSVTITFTWEMMTR